MSADEPFFQNTSTQDVLFNFTIGASVSLVASALSSLGVNLQAASLRRSREQNLLVGEIDGLSFSIDDEDDDVAGRSYGQRGAGKAGPSSPVESSAERGGKAFGDNVGVGGGGAGGSSSSRSSAKGGMAAAAGRRQRFIKKWQRWQWHVGFSLYLICQLFGSVIALGFISPVILAPLGSASLIFNVVFSRVFLGTRIAKKDWGGTFLVVVGCAIVSTFGSGGSETKQTLDDLIRLFSRSTFMLYITVQATCILAVFGLVKYLEYGTDVLRFFHFLRRGAATRDETRPLLSSAASSSASISVSSDPTMRHVARVKGDLIGALYGVVGGAVASETLLLTKSGVELLIVSIFDPPPTTSPTPHTMFPILLLLALCTTVFLQLYSLNRGMHHTLPTVVVPVFYTFYTVLSLANTLVFMDAWDTYKTPDLACVGGGMVAIVVGVVLLAGGGKEEGEREVPGVVEEGYAVLNQQHQQQQQGDQSLAAVFGGSGTSITSREGGGSGSSEEDGDDEDERAAVRRGLASIKNRT
ncbi:hypothetical protein HKX48_002313 [Thoreauomyces humboldtii]|nr:hypothetical protein HKX48_002313 [Thoreauomyces humboldtii]